MTRAGPFASCCQEADAENSSVPPGGSREQQMEHRLEQQMAAEQFLRTGQLSHPFGLRQAFFYLIIWNLVLDSSIKNHEKNYPPHKNKPFLDFYFFFNFGWARAFTLALRFSAAGVSKKSLYSFKVRLPERPRPRSFVQPGKRELLGGRLHLLLNRLPLQAQQTGWGEPEADIQAPASHWKQVQGVGWDA